MKVFDILFPKRCPYCDELMELDNKYCCDKCKTFFEIRLYSNKINDFQCISPFYYEDKYKQAIINYKFHNRPYYAKQLANALLEAVEIEYENIKFDIVTSVPLSKENIKTRQYNQSELLARFISKRMNLNYSNLLIKHKSNLPQHTLPREERAQNVIGVYSAKSGNENYKNILLIDDIMTTGCTLNECVKILKSKYECKIYCATLAVV